MPYYDPMIAQGIKDASARGDWKAVQMLMHQRAVSQQVNPPPKPPDIMSGAGAPPISQRIADAEARGDWKAVQMLMHQQAVRQQGNPPPKPPDIMSGAGAPPSPPAQAPQTVRTSGLYDFMAQRPGHQVAPYELPNVQQLPNNFQDAMAQDAAKMHTPMPPDPWDTYARAYQMMGRGATAPIYAQGAQNAANTRMEFANRGLSNTTLLPTALASQGTQTALAAGEARQRAMMNAVGATPTLMPPYMRPDFSGVKNYWEQMGNQYGLQRMGLSAQR